MNVDKKLLETEFMNAICRPTGDKWQSKALFLVIFICVVKSVFDCRLSGVYLNGNMAAITISINFHFKILTLH